MIILQCMSGRAEENHEITSIKMSELLAEIRTHNFLNTKEECNQLHSHVQYFQSITVSGAQIVR